MFPFPPKRSKMKPVLFPEIFLRSKEGDLWHNPHVLDGEHAWFLKYFPKYFKRLILKGGERISRAVQSKVQKLKVVRSCTGFYRLDHPQNDFKRLLRSNRKTLTKIPYVVYFDGSERDLSSCLYFPKLKTIGFIGSERPPSNSYQKQTHKSSPLLKEIYCSYGYFWGGNRHLESLSLKLSNEFNLILLKKLDRSERFLSSLMKLSFSIYASNEIMVKLMKYKNFLKHVTHLVIQSTREQFDWEVVQSLLNCCSHLHSLSLPTGYSRWRGEPHQDFCLDLGCLQNLQSLNITAQHFRFFLNGIDFPLSLREMTLKMEDYDNLNNFSDIFEVQKEENNEMRIENEDAREWASFEKYKILNDFFEKCKQLSHLRTLNLIFDVQYQLDILRRFILPLLKAIPQLAAFRFNSSSGSHNCSREHKLFDLEVFFSEIQSIQSLKIIHIKSHPWDKWTFPGSCDPQKLKSLSNLSSFKITGAKIYSDFDLKKFLNAFVDRYDIAKSKNLAARKTAKLPDLHISSILYFIRTLNLMGSLAHFKNLEVELQIFLFVENLEEIYSNFQYPIYVPQNAQLKLSICFKHFEGSIYTFEQKQYFNMIFGQLKFTLNRARPSFDYGKNPLHPKYDCDRQLTTNIPETEY